MSARTLRAALLAGLAALLVAGCAALQPREIPDDRDAAWEALQADLEALDAWHARGRLSVRMDHDGGSAGFDWREQADGRYALRLAGPFGEGVARLDGRAGHVRLDEGDGRVLQGSDARLLLLERYGWDVPVDGLRHWLIGLPGSDVEPDAYELDDFGRLQRLQWEEWEIRYRRYIQVDGLDLPADLIVEHGLDDTRIRIAVDEWQPASAEVDDGTGVPLIGE